MSTKRKVKQPDAPQLHADHARPVTRREFVSQGLLTGSAFAATGGVMSLFSNPREAMAAISGDLQGLLNSPCNIATVGAGKIPFIAFDLAGGANIANSNVLVGQQGGQMDFLGTNGYEKMGLPGDMVPGLNDPISQLPYANMDLGLAFHSDSPFLRGMRREGEIKDERAGRCMGACIEYAARIGVPLMMYVFSDGSVSSNGQLDTSQAGRGKGFWVSDNSSTAASFFLVYNPNGRPTLLGGNASDQALHQQIGYMSSDGSVQRAATPAANNVNLLVETIILNYMALHGQQNQFGTLFPTNGLGDATLQDRMTAFAPLAGITNGTIGPLLPLPG